MYDVVTYRSPIGKIILAGREEYLAGLWFEGQKYFGDILKGEVFSEGKTPTPVLKAAMDWLDQYFAGQRPNSGKLPIEPSGSDFRKEVWKILCEIPYGETTTYGKIAEQMAQKMSRKSMSPQAVGGAVGHNPISIIIPCHRVLGADGSLTGYAGGTDRKLWLLKHEGGLCEGTFEI